MNDEFVCGCLTYAPLVQHVYPRVTASRPVRPAASRPTRPAIFFCSCSNYSFRLMFAFFVCLIILVSVGVCCCWRGGAWLRAEALEG